MVTCTNIYPQEIGYDGNSLEATDEEDEDEDEDENKAKAKAEMKTEN